ncbi:MAG: hypothetical protein NDJ94_13615 [Vicinamibacteria bacterium]|nr:hypothetical protein [Vicinamibacteria bacterium]
MDSPTTLVDVPVLALDVQATAAASRAGALLEVGWAWAHPDEVSAAVSACVVAPPTDFVLPRPVERLTGLSNAEWRRGQEPSKVWTRLAAEAGGGGLVPTVVHYSRFEEPFLRALHVRHGSGDFPFDLLCTHAIARRLLPELPRRTLRALAGYFGAAVPPLRRSAGHVQATILVWRHLTRLLADREGLTRLAELRDWLRQPARRVPRCFALDPGARRALPDAPGVYRFHRAGGAVLYVGKATSLRKRVASHFHARAPHERSLEMLTQVRDVTCSPTATVLEAALLEADEIKRLAPPYNVALLEAGRGLCYATTRLDHVQPEPDREHRVGPLASPLPIEALQALRLAIREPDRATCVLRARAVGVEPAWAPGPECFGAGLASFVTRRGPIDDARGVERLGRALWAARPAARRSDDEGEPGEPAERRPTWDAARVAQALDVTAMRATHAARRATWLLRLSECTLAWAGPDATEGRRLTIEGGHVVDAGTLDPDAPLPTPAGYARTRDERQRRFDLATFDRLRVLATELRTLSPRASRLELRLGPHVSLSRRRLSEVLRWI